MDNKIIIIEDNKVAFYKLKENVEQIGPVVVSYNEINDALLVHNTYSTITDLIEKKYDKYGKEISLFIIDLKLCGDSADGGIGAIKVIRSKFDNSYWRSIVPIIVYTNYANYEELAMKAKANVLIRKIKEIEMEESALSEKKTWKNKLETHLTTILLPEIRAYIDWYVASIEKIERTPLNIRQSVISFFRVNNDPNIKHAFIMTSFEKNYEKAIEKALEEVKKHYLVETHMANTNGEVSDDLFANISGLMHCCDFGIGIFFDDSKKGNAINPNLALEVGYMLGIGKKICYLKDNSLPQLPVDLISKIYTKYKKTKTAKGKDIPVMTDALMKWIQDVSKELKIEERPG